MSPTLKLFYLIGSSKISGKGSAEYKIHDTVNGSKEVNLRMKIKSQKSKVLLCVNY